MDQHTNSTLLVANNAPIKIYLDGFDVLDFLHTAKVIRMHGGCVSKPSHETLILTPPNRQPSTKFIQFSTDWLHETIKHNTRQDVGKYLLPRAALSPPTMPTEPREIDGRVQDLKKSPREDKTNEVDSTGFNERHENQESDDATNISASTTSLTSLVEPRSPPGATKDAPTSGPAASSDPPEVTREEIANSALSEVDPDGDGGRSLNPPADQEHLYTLVNGCWRFTGSTVEKISQIALDHQFSPQRATPAAPGNEAQRRAAPGARRKRVHPMMVTKRKRAKTDLLPRIKYSFAEDQKIIEYLIKHDAIAMVDGHSVWDDMARDEEILRGRSAASLKYRFTTNLRHSFRRYTDDPEALRQFEALEAGPRSTDE